MFYFVLGYSQLTMLWPFQENSEGTQMYIYIYPASFIFNPPPKKEIIFLCENSQF